MACGSCGGSSQPAAKYRVTTEQDPTGKVYLSETEARAEVSRVGGGTITRVS